MSSKYKIVYRDRGEQATDPDTSGWFKIYIKKLWGWKDTGVTSYSKVEARKAVARMKNNPEEYL